jgi:hypothetical protein
MLASCPHFPCLALRAYATPRLPAIARVSRLRQEILFGVRINLVSVVVRLDGAEPVENYEGQRDTPFPFRARFFLLASAARRFCLASAAVPVGTPLPPKTLDPRPSGASDGRDP